MKETVLITGGAGFLGAHVAQHCLDLGFKVVIIDDLSGGFKENIPDGCVFYEGSICDAPFVNSVFAENSFKFVYNLAAYAAENLSVHIKNFNYMNNVIGSVNIINACVNHDVKCLVFTSSIAVMAEGNAPYYETDPFFPGDSYGNAKMIIEYELHQSLHRFGLNHVIFRPFNIYGPKQNIGDKYRNVIGIFMNQIMKGEQLTVFGDGEQTRSFSFVSDVAPHIAACVLRPELYNNTFYIGGSIPYSINELASVVAAEFGVLPNIKYLEPRIEARHAHANTEKARSAFGPAEVGLAEGVKIMADWARVVGARKSKEFSNIEIRKNLPEGW